MALVLGLVRVPAGASEKQLLAQFQDSFGSPDPSLRSAALTALGEGSRGLEDKGTSKAVARALAKGLEDADLDVCNAALGQLGHGRAVEVVIAGLADFLREVFEELEGRVERTDGESREYVSRASVLFVNGCRVLATYRDDRSVALLAAWLSDLPPLTARNDLSTRLVGPLAACTLDLGTLEAATVAVKLTKVFEGPAQEPAARALYAALAEFATRLGAAPPVESEASPEAWQAWLEANKATLPKKLGRLALPPPEGPTRALDGMPGKSG